MGTPSRDVDVFVIGGGINGVGIAMDAVGRGLSVTLCESHDLASGTSSNSSKLIHGGLRYLEQYQFSMVRKALAEREILLAAAPHIMWPMRFRLPHRPHLRPAWMLRLGLFIYDHLTARQHLPSSESVRFSDADPLKSDIKKGFEYSDAWVDDSRLVVLCAKEAHRLGAKIKPRTRCVQAVREEGRWSLTLENTETGEQEHCYSRVLINAAGPWASALFGDVFAMPAPKQLRLVKGSHIVVPKLHDQAQSYILQHTDQRIVFVTPFEENFSLIGTTDVDYVGDPAKVAIEPAEITYLCEVVNTHFKQQISAQDVVWSYAGVRPLVDGETKADDAQKISRDYSFSLDAPTGAAPLLSVFGGKITTYRLLAEAATDAIKPYFSAMTPRWTKKLILPGGHFDSPAALTAQLQQRYPWLESNLLQRYIRSYGNLCECFLSGAESMTDLGRDFGAGLTISEVNYLIAEEWAGSAADILWRRTKLGLVFTEQQTLDLAQYVQARRITLAQD